MAKAIFIGSGNLGSCIAFECAVNGLFKEIVMTDSMKEVAGGQAKDILQAACLENNVDVRAGGYEELDGAQVAIVSAGAARSAGNKSRMELMNTNYAVVREVARKLRDFEGTVITLTNPMDVMNYFMFKESGLDRERVIGSGGMLDGARFLTELSQRFECQSTKVEAHVIGEHGDLMVPVFSRVKVCGESREFSVTEREETVRRMKDEALSVITSKGATTYAPARATYLMIKAITEGGLIVGSHVLEGEYGQSNVSAGVPLMVGKKGVKKVLEWNIDEWERERLSRACEFLKGEIRRI